MTKTSQGGLGLRALLLSGFSVLLVLLTIMAAVGAFQLRALYLKVEVLAAENIEFLISAGKSQALNGEIGITVRDIVNTSNVAAQKENIKRLNAAQNSFHETLKQMTAFAEARSPNELGNLKTLMKRFDDSKLVFDEIINLVDEADFDGARDSIFKKLRPIQQEVSTLLNAFQERQSTGAKEQAELARQAYSTALMMMAGVVVGGIVAGIVIALTIIGRVMTPLTQAADFAGQIAAGNLMVRMSVQGGDEIARLLASLNGMAEQLAAMVNQIRGEARQVGDLAGALALDAKAAGERSQSQVDQVMEMTSAVEEMTVSIGEVSRSAGGVENAATEARRLIEEGNRSMEHNLSEMAEIVRHVDASRTIVGELNQELKQINEITKVIKDIAGQTNLLALNAAIEAARAGEQGRGFAVVADEVRKLAERTQQSTGEIAGMLEKIDRSAAQAVASMEQVRSSVDTGATDTRAVGDKLHQILAAAVEVSNLVTTIADATREQSRTSELTARSIEAVSALTEETNATIGGVARTAGNMQTVSGELQTLVDKFKT